MKKTIKHSLAVGIAAGFAMLAGGAIAHDGGTNDAGTPVCLEANYMVADAQFAPASSSPGPGRVIEQNIITGERGITVNNPFGTFDADVCPDGVVCPGPWKPTGTFSGGQKGHAYITSAAQHALTELHRDGTAIRTLSYNEVLGVTPGDGDGFGHVPRPLGTQIMPNGNLVQAICDANFNQVPPAGGGAANSDPNPGFWPPVWTSDARRANSRILVIDQDTLEVIDEYSQPAEGELGHDLWGCMAGIMFDDESMYSSLFHGGAILAIDWRQGVSGTSGGVGSNAQGNFKIGDDLNRAHVTRVIDFVGGKKTTENPDRRDSMRAITFDEEGNIYGTNRRRSQPCKAGDACNPGVFRQRVSIDLVSTRGKKHDEDATLALDPGVNVIAGIRINRMSHRACEAVLGGAVSGATDEDCNVETLYVAASAMNPGEILNLGGCTGGHPANACLKMGGYVAEYLIDEAHLDGGSAWGGGDCNGDPTDPAGNTGCAQPIATFGGVVNGNQNLDPRMLMPIQRAFIQ
jgi:hypothetical protein